MWNWWNHSKKWEKILNQATFSLVCTGLSMILELARTTSSRQPGTHWTLFVARNYLPLRRREVTFDKQALWVGCLLFLGVFDQVTFISARKDHWPGTTSTYIAEILRQKLELLSCTNIWSEESDRWLCFQFCCESASWTFGTWVPIGKILHRNKLRRLHQHGYARTSCHVLGKRSSVYNPRVGFYS